MINLLDISWCELEKMPRSETVFFQVIAPVEEHSHHLPLGTDLFLGEIWAKKAIKILEENKPKLNCIMMPILPVAAGSMKGFPGCLYQRAKDVRKVLYSVLQNLAQFGFQNIIVVASHGDPMHQISVEKACEMINSKYGEVAISPLGSIVFSGMRPTKGANLSTELDKMLQKYKFDFHAGWVETSMIMAEKPELIKSDIYSMPDIEVTDREMINPSVYLKKTAGWGHLGYPKLSDQKLGNELNNITSSDLAIVVDEFVEKKDCSMYKHHFLWKLPIFRILT